MLDYGQPHPVHGCVTTTCPGWPEMLTLPPFELPAFTPELYSRYVPVPRQARFSLGRYIDLRLVS